MRRTCRISLIVGLIAIAIAALPLTTSAAVFATTAFQQQWQADESRVPNFWGPLSTAHDGMLEPYAGATSGAICPPATTQACPAFLVTGKRMVQYFDKGRMEQTNPGAPVTSGLLATELVRGKVQTGDTQFEDRTPPNISIAGDADNPTPTYAQLATTANALLSPAPSKPGSFVTVFINVQGQVEDGGGFAGISMTPPIAGYDAPTQHNVLGVFADYRNQAGLLVIGYAISEPFRATVKVGGQQRTVLVQVFERRVLTYTSSNPDPFKVEMGNIGQHYYLWRYPNGPSADTNNTGNSSGARDTVMQFFQALQTNADPSRFFSPGTWDNNKNALYQGLGVTAPLPPFAITCERDTVLNTGFPPVRDVLVTFTTGGGQQRTIVRLRSQNGAWLIDGFISKAPSGDPVPANYCSI